MSSEDSDIDEKLVDLRIGEGRKENPIINILLLGETGVGKSTFINSIANYVTYKYFDSAEKNPLFVLVPSMFGIEDKYKKEHKINIGEAIDGNEYLDVGLSATQGVKSYLFPIGKNNSKVRIIDTPGMGDTRGIEQDENNWKNIFNYISKLDYLHAICFLFKPTEARRTIFLEYCFSQILCRLDKFACSKLFFVFTKTRGANYGATETLAVLEALVSEIKKYSPDVNIPLIYNKNVFCFDNEGFRYLAARQQMVEFEEDDKKNYKKSWKRSVKQWGNLFKSIQITNQTSQYTPIRIHDITKARNGINSIAKVLLQIADQITDNEAILQKLLDKQNTDMIELEELKGKQLVKAIVVYKIPKSNPAVVCNASSCVEIVKVGKEDQRHYKHVCHQECEELKHVEKDIIGHPELVNCLVINKGTGQCVNCGCDFSSHSLITYQTLKKEDYITDEKISKEIAEKEILLRSSRDIVSDYERKNVELANEQESLKEVSSKLASFIRQIAIIAFNYCYNEYVEQCIRSEQSNQSCNKILINTYKKLLRENEELSKIFEDALLANEAVCLLDWDFSLEEIEGRYEQIFSLKYAGSRFKELLDKELVLIENDTEVSEYVHDIKFDQKKGREFKGKQKKEKNKDNIKKKNKKKVEGSDGEEINEADGEHDDNDDGGTKEKKKKKKNKTNAVKETENEDNENGDIDSSSRQNDSNNQPKKQKMRHRNRPKIVSGNQDQGDSNWIENDNNNQRSRTPPPPYSQAFSSSQPSRHSGVQPHQNQPTGENMRTKNNQHQDNKYEIQVSIKARDGRPSTTYDPNYPPRTDAFPSHQNPSYGFPPNSEYYPPYPPPHGSMPPHDQNVYRRPDPYIPQQNFPIAASQPQYPSQGDYRPSHPPRPHNPPAVSFRPGFPRSPNPRYASHGHNPPRAPYDPRYQHQNIRSPQPNTGLSSHPRFPLKKTNENTNQGKKHGAKDDQKKDHKQGTGSNKKENSSTKKEKEGQVKKKSEQKSSKQKNIDDKGGK